MITPDGYRILQKFIKPGQHIIELGDQICDWSGKYAGRRADEVLAELHGVTVQTVDIHGKNRAIPYDLNTYPAGDLQPADIVTDFGTMEHTDSPMNVLRNIRRWLKDGGISIHANPDVTYEKHGNFYLRNSFWLAYCWMTGSELLHFEITPVYQKTNPHHEIYAVVRHEKNFNETVWNDNKMQLHYNYWS